MAEHHPKTDLEVRFEMFKKQYHDRQAEAKRTGKPIPAHTQRWYDKQIEEYRTSLKRLGLIMTLSMPTVAEAVERIAAVKQKVDARAPVVSPEQKKKERQEKVRQYTKAWAERRVLTGDQREKLLEAARERDRKRRQKERERRAAARQTLREEGIKVEVHVPEPLAAPKDIMAMRVEKKRAKQRRKRAKKMARINACPELREAYLERERQRSLRYRSSKRDPSLVTAAMLKTEAFIADAIKSGQIDPKEQKLCAHSIRMAQSHLTQEERKRLNHKRAEQRRQEKRNADRIASLTAKIVEPGWAERAIETDQELRGLFDDYIARSVNSTVWYKVTHNIPHTAEDVAAIKAQRTFLLLLNLNADHNFLHRLDKLRKESLRRSGEKQWALIKNNPERYEQYKRDAAEAYAKKQAKRIKMGVEAISDEIASQAVFDHWAAVYEVARKNARKI
jgi:hypothetical protein